MVRGGAATVFVVAGADEVATAGLGGRVAAGLADNSVELANTDGS